MPTYTLTSTHACLRCGATAQDARPAGYDTDGKLAVSQTPHARGWREVTLPHPSGPLVRGEMCPDCVAQLMAFVLPSKEA